MPARLVFKGCSVPFFRNARALHVLALRASDTFTGTLRLGVCRWLKISFIRPHKGTVKSRGVGVCHGAEQVTKKFSQFSQFTCFPTTKAHILTRAEQRNKEVVEELRVLKKQLASGSRKKRWRRPRRGRRRLRSLCRSSAPAHTRASSLTASATDRVRAPDMGLTTWSYISSL